ncbi:MAG TPA: hypothetical protein VKF40_04835 [Burkholderiales bacterium]|nr:hypothetical protein [Burkholderiales bacterium]
MNHSARLSTALVGLTIDRLQGQRYSSRAHFSKSRAGSKQANSTVASREEINRPNAWQEPRPGSGQRNKVQGDGMLKYSDLGTGRQLNQIVMAGSHDAGVTEGGGNVQTQNMDIYLQANAGVRLFDIRIAAVAQKDQGLGKQAQLKAYHSAIKFKSEGSRHLTDLGKQTDVKMAKLAGGEWGEALTKMLSDARRFVQDNPDEFLILKFDKCTNWTAIAEACVRFLGNSIYSKAGNLNTKKIRDLGGSVIVLFGQAGVAEAKYPASMGILGFRNLASGGTYDPDFNGLQYLGKGGTSVARPFFKISQNKANQAKLMKKGGDADPNVMGMMYWTTTGIFENIKKRNDTMWTENKQSALKKLWSNGLAESIESRLAKNIDPTTDSAGGMLKTFMPNFVMIDFSDAEKCKTIYDLNSVAATSLTAAWKNATAA